MTNQTSRFGTLGDFNPAGSGTDMADAAMSKWERSQPKSSGPSADFVTYGNPASGDGVTIEQYILGDDQVQDRVEKSINIGSMSRRQEFEGKSYNFNVSISKEYSDGANLWVNCGQEDQTQSVIQVCQEAIRGFSLNASEIAKNIASKLTALGID